MVDDADVCEVVDELRALFEDKKSKATAAGFFAQFSQIPAVGPRALRVEIYHKVDDENEIYEFIKGNHRLLCFEAEGRLVICSHVLRKKSQKTSAKDRRKAAALRTAYLASKAAGNISVLEDDGE